MIKNLVLSSGSIIGISYLGCLQILEKRNMINNIENILRIKNLPQMKCKLIYKNIKI